MEENKSGVIANLEQDNPAIENKIDAVGLKVDEVFTKASTIDSRLDGINSDMSKPLNQLIDKYGAVTNQIKDDTYNLTTGLANKQIQFGAANSRVSTKYLMPFAIGGKSFANIGNLIYFFGAGANKQAVYSYDIVTRKVVRMTDSLYRLESGASNRAAYFVDNQYKGKVFLYMLDAGGVCGYDIVTGITKKEGAAIPIGGDVMWMFADKKRKALLCVSSNTFAGSAFYRYKIADGTWETIATRHGALIVKVQPFTDGNKLCVLTRTSTNSADVSFWIYDIESDESKLLFVRTGDTQYTNGDSIESYAINDCCVFNAGKSAILVTSEKLETFSSAFESSLPYLSMQMKDSNVLIEFVGDFVRYAQNGYFKDIITVNRIYFMEDTKVFSERWSVTIVPQSGKIEQIELGAAGGEFVVKKGNYCTLDGLYTI